MDNMSFDDSLKVNMVELIGQDGVLQNLGGLNVPTHDYISLLDREQFNAGRLQKRGKRGNGSRHSRFRV